VRLKELPIQKGDVIRVQRDDSGDDRAGYCIIDLVDLEEVAPPELHRRIHCRWQIYALAGAIRAETIPRRSGTASLPLRKPARRSGSLPGLLPLPGYRRTGHITIQGAGMWYSELEGDEKSYMAVNKRIRLIGTGSDIHSGRFCHYRPAELQERQGKQ